MCGQTGAISDHTTWHSSLRHVNEGQRATPHSWLLPLGSCPPDTLFTPPPPSDRPPWRLCDYSCFTLSYQVNLSCSHRRSAQLDANKLRHYEMNEKFFILAFTFNSSGWKCWEQRCFSDKRKSTKLSESALLIHWNFKHRTSIIKIYLKLNVTNLKCMQANKVLV